MSEFSSIPDATKENHEARVANGETTWARMAAEAVKNGYDDIAAWAASHSDKSARGADKGAEKAVTETKTVR